MMIRTHITSLTRPVLAAGATALLWAASVPAQQIDMNAWKQSNEYRAMHLQRELAADMPQSQSLVLGSHNSYNSNAYTPGYVLFQHSYTLSQQLDLGLRSLDLDVHALPFSPTELFVTHATCLGAGSLASDLTLPEVFAELRGWLDNNPNEVIILCIEPHFPMEYPSTQHGRFLSACEAYFGSTSGNDRIIRPSEIAEYEWSTEFPENDEQWQRELMKFSDMSLNDLRAIGRVMFINIGGASNPCDGDEHYWPNQDDVNNVIFGNAPSFSWLGKRNWDFIEAKRFVEEPNLGYWSGTQSLGARVRSGEFIGGGSSDRFRDRSLFTFLYNNTSEGQLSEYGSEPPSTVREAIRAGMDVIRFDPVGRSAASSSGIIEFPADEQMRATIWSWDYRNLPPIDGVPRAGMAVIDGDTARIRAESPSASMRYAVQTSWGEWRLSDERGSFADATAPGTNGLSFRVPGNGFEMQNLFGEMVRAGVTRVWINYHDLDGDGAWTASTQERENWHPDSVRASAVPILISNQSELVFSQNPAVTPPQTFGLVFSVYPGAYVPTSQPIRLRNAGTIVPWAPDVPTVIGR